MKQFQRVTIKDVARIAGVSAQTVSRVINDRPDVAAETRDRVQQIIDDISYQPSALARSLIQQRSFTLGVVTAGLQYIGPSRTLNGITQQAEELGYSLLLKELPRFTTEDISPQIQSLIARHVDGIIWAVAEVGENQNWIIDHIMDIPVPILFISARKKPGILSVSYDNFLGGRIATEHLIDQGFRHIGHIAGPMDWWEAQQRKQGWETALRESGLEVRETGWQEGNWSSASGEQACLRLLDSYSELDALFAANDQMALGALQVACRKNLSVPADLGLIGFDGIPETRYYWPSLSTVFQDQNRLGCVAVEKIIEIIESTRLADKKIEMESVVLNPELIIRDSTLISK